MRKVKSKVRLSKIGSEVYGKGYIVADRVDRAADFIIARCPERDYILAPNEYIDIEDIIEGLEEENGKA